MGARGPAPKATALKALEGNPGKRPLNDREPLPATGATCPDWLSAAARAQWSRLAPILEACGTLTRADENILAAYCDAAANYIAATREVQELESFIETGPHGRKVSPVVGAQRNYLELMVKLGTKLGLSPSDRTSIKVPPPQGDQWQDLISH